MSNYLDSLLNRIEDADLRKAFTEQIALLRDAKQFGLVFEEHLPETVRLFSHPVRRAITVQERANPDGPIWVVSKVAKGQATLVREVEGERLTETRRVADLVVIREFGAPIYPGLTCVNRISRGGDKPFHTVINGENYHVLEALQYTHESKVDCIYIDPPYNLGGDLTYNDKRIGKDDAFRHSKWLSFMDRRLRLARTLMKETGVIIVAIDDTEHAHLRLLMDQVFGESNFIACVVWQGGHKNDARYVSVGHDYMLIYARDEAALRAADIRWRERKPGLDEALDAAAAIWRETEGDHPEATKRWRQWMKKFKASGVATDAVTRYTSLDEATGVPIFTGRDVSWPGGGGPRYDVLHPVTQKPVKVPSRGWAYTDPAKLQQLIAAGRIRFGPDETSGVQGVSFLNELETQPAKSVFSKDRRGAAQQLTKLFGERRFDFPKDVEVLARWIDLVTQSNPEAVVLDFFAGSGSTAQAVMELNSRDGGRRQAIIVTNNEVEESAAKKLGKAGHHPGDAEWEADGIFRKVTKPRLETLVTGEREDGSRHSDGMAENVVFLETTYQDRDTINLGRAFKAVAPLLWMKAGGTGPCIDTLPTEATWAVPAGSVYGILFDTQDLAAFIAEVHARPEVRHAYVVTSSHAVFQQVVAELPPTVETTMLYEDYLSTFEINTRAGAA